jgi:hypothetical protein
MLTTERLWAAYARVQAARSSGATPAASSPTWSRWCASLSGWTAKAPN